MVKYFSLFLLTILSSFVHAESQQIRNPNYSHCYNVSHKLLSGEFTNTLLLSYRDLPDNYVVAMMKLKRQMTDQYEIKLLSNAECQNSLKVNTDRLYFVK